MAQRDGRRSIRSAASCVILLLLDVSPIPAQSAVSAPVPVVVSGSLRTRVESWNWFGANPEGEYTYPGSLFRMSAAQSDKSRDWQVEVALPFLFDLPDRALAPGAQGPLGLGANYFAANDNHANVAALFVKQAFVRFKGAEQSLTFGRIEFVDGAEIAPKNRTLALLKRDRIAHRLLGNFIFTHVGRSFDGVLYARAGLSQNLTVIAARPTNGVFQVNGWGELDVNVFYGAWTRQTGGAGNAGEWRAFGLGYHDYRNDVLKTDNRPLADRRADAGSIGIATVGGHYLGVAETAAGSVDVLAWGAVQAGSWGALDHRAAAVAAEAGWQPALSTMNPWVRGGYAYASGDGDPDDRRHGTFFQVLPTPRVYARFPFFNLMNTRDLFGELIVRPMKALTVRADAHAIRLADAADLWYQGGGAFQPETFGYTGRPSSGHSSLAFLYDTGCDARLSERLDLSGYYGVATGKAVPETIYPGDRRARFGYLEAIVRF